jgi:hypothetical protein
MRRFTEDKLLKKYEKKALSSLTDVGFKKRLKDDERFKDTSFKRTVPRFLYKKSNIFNPLGEVHKKYKVVIDYSKGEQVTNSLIYHITNFCLKCNLKNPPPFTISKVRYFLVDQNPLDGVILKGKPGVCTLKGGSTDAIVTNFYYSGKEAVGQTMKIKINDSDIYYKLDINEKIAICSYTNTFEETIKVSMEYPSITSVVPNINLAAGGYYNYETSLSNGRYEVINFVTEEDIKVYGNDAEKYNKLVPDAGYIVYDVIISDVDITDYSEWKKIVSKCDYYNTKIESILKMLPGIKNETVYTNLVDDHRGKPGGVHNIINGFDSIVSKTIQFTSNFIKLFIEGSGYNIVYNYKKATNYFVEDFTNQIRKYTEYLGDKIIDLVQKTKLEGLKTDFTRYTCFTKDNFVNFSSNKYIMLWERIKGDNFSLENTRGCLLFAYEFSKKMYSKVRADYEISATKYKSLSENSIELFTEVKNLIFSYFQTQLVKSKVYSMLMNGISDEKVEEILSIQKGEISIKEKSIEYAKKYGEIYDRFKTHFNGVNLKYEYVVKFSRALEHGVNSLIDRIQKRSVFKIKNVGGMDVEGEGNDEDGDGDTESDTYIRDAIETKVFNFYSYLNDSDFKQFNPDETTLLDSISILEETKDFILNSSEELLQFIIMYDKMMNILYSFKFKETLEEYIDAISKKNNIHCHKNDVTFIENFSIHVVRKLIKLYETLLDAGDVDHLDIMSAVNNIVFSSLISVNNTRYDRFKVIVHRFAPLAQYQTCCDAISEYINVLKYVCENTFSGDATDVTNLRKCDIVNAKFMIDNKALLESESVLRQISIKLGADLCYNLFYLKTIEKKSITDEALKKNIRFLHTNEYKLFLDDKIIGDKMIWVSGKLVTRWTNNTKLSKKEFNKLSEVAARRIIYYSYCNRILYTFSQNKRAEVKYSITDKGVYVGYIEKSLYYIVEVTKSIDDIHKGLMRGDKNLTSAITPYVPLIGDRK